MTAVTLQESPWRQTILFDDFALASAHSCTWMPWGSGNEFYVRSCIMWGLVMFMCNSELLNPWTPGLQFEPILLNTYISIQCLIVNNQCHNCTSKVFKLSNSTHPKDTHDLTNPSRTTWPRTLPSPGVSCWGVQTPGRLNSWRPQHARSQKDVLGRNMRSSAYSWIPLVVVDGLICESKVV